MLRTFYTPIYFMLNGYHQAHPWPQITCLLVRKNTPSCLLTHFFRIDQLNLCQWQHFHDLSRHSLAYMNWTNCRNRPIVYLSNTIKHRPHCKASRLFECIFFTTTWVNPVRVAINWDGTRFEIIREKHTLSEHRYKCLKSTPKTAGTSPYSGATIYSLFNMEITSI